MGDPVTEYVAYEIDLEKVSNGNSDPDGVILVDHPEEH